MKTDGPGGSALAHISYRWLCAALLLTTLCEWAVFVERELWGINERLLVPGLLVVSGLKFLAAIGWLIRAGAALDVGKRALLVILVMSGGLLILPGVLVK